MNEALFIFQILFIVGSILFSLRWGKSVLVAMISLLGVIANLFVIKEVTLFGLEVTTTDVYAIGMILGLNLVQEYFGKKAAKKAVYISFFFMSFFVIMAKIFLAYTATFSDQSHLHFEKILGLQPRIVIASLISFFVTQLLDRSIFGFLKKVYQNRYFTFRFWLSATIGQMADTLLFSFLALFGVVNSIWHIILFSFLMKTICLFISSFLIGVSYRWIKKGSAIEKQEASPIENEKVMI